jgi:hypothetical protein
VVERIFGVLKERFECVCTSSSYAFSLTKLLSILDSPPRFSMQVQAKIPPGMAAVHNFIRMHDPEEINSFAHILAPSLAEEQFGKLAEGVPSRAERERAAIDRDDIAEDMWADYQLYRHTHGML